jgi:hypothetical protein
VHFCSHLCTFGKTFRSVTHPEIVPGQARLTPEFFIGGLSEKKVYVNGMSILSIILSLELGYHIDKDYVAIRKLLVLGTELVTRKCS